MSGSVKGLTTEEEDVSICLQKNSDWEGVYCWTKTHWKLSLSLLKQLITWPGISIQS